jgi:putative ABC transport system permease protein
MGHSVSKLLGRINNCHFPFISKGCGFYRAKGGFSGDSPSLPAPPAQGCYPESEGFFSNSHPSEPCSGMNKLIFANLLHRPVRSVISVLAVAIEVIMILSIVGIFMGMLNDTKQRTNGIGADLMMRPSNASIFAASAARPCRQGHRGAPQIAPCRRGLAGDSEVEHRRQDRGPDLRHRVSQLQCVSSPLSSSPAGRFRGPMTPSSTTSPPAPMAAISWATDHRHGPSFRICGHRRARQGRAQAVPIDTMGELMGAEGKASLFYIKCDDPANDKAVIEEIHSTRGLEDYPVETIDEWLAEMTPEKIPGFNIALNVVTFIAVVVGFLVIFQSMYTAVLERTREIGILKSMGASKPSIVGVVLRETAVMALAGVLLGIAGTFGVKLLMAHLFPHAAL